MAAIVRVRLLGPVDVMAGGAVRTVSGLRRKAVLAALALQAGEIVSTDRLADTVWGDHAPPRALNTLQSHASYLRTVLGSKAAILAKPPGYVLDLGGEGTDVRLAERLLRQASLLADPAHAAAELREALALWRGKPLADVTGSAWLEQQAERLGLLCEQIERALAGARLASGEHAQLVPQLERMVADHPLDEGLHAQLMLALYRSGHQADALAAYQRLRVMLGERLGIDPSQALRDLETAILRQDTSLSLDAPAGAVMLPGTTAWPPATSPSPVPVPAQLPPTIAGFAGRDAELASLDAILPRPAANGTTPAGTVVISAIAGTAGAGKTALALHWAHRVRDQFPDGQLYVNLRGFDPSGPALDPDQALRGFFDAFGVPPERVPVGVQAKAGLYRSLLSGKRMLVVLDNARDTEQVRPLLPGTAGCLALVTSRNQLIGLIAADGGYPLSLGLLTVPEAYDLLTRRLGARRVAAERRAAEQIITSCARLPAGLARAHLLTEHRPGRYAFHDLLRAYAAEQAQAHEDDDARREAIHRMLDHYLHTAETAASRLNPVRDPAATTPPRPGVTCDDVADYQQALAWFTAERPVLLTTVAQAFAGFGTYAWQLASALTCFLDLRGHWQDQKDAQAAGSPTRDSSNSTTLVPTTCSPWSVQGTRRPHRPGPSARQSAMGSQISSATSMTRSGPA